jgi:hypothetical protein
MALGRVVHVDWKGRYEVEENRTYDRAWADDPEREPAGVDENGQPFWLRHDEVGKNPVLACPDCHRTLVAANDHTIKDYHFLVCGGLRTGPGAFLMKPCHRDCIVACGQRLAAT